MHKRSQSFCGVCFAAAFAVANVDPVCAQRRVRDSDTNHVEAGEVSTRSTNMTGGYSGKTTDMDNNKLIRVWETPCVSTSKQAICS